MGRPITDIASALLYPQLADDAPAAPAHTGQSGSANFARQRRLVRHAHLPYRTLENMIDGVVITFTDITVSKKLEAELKSSEQ